MSPLQPDTDWLALIDFLQPPKAAALAFLDVGGAKPPRYGRVTVVRGTADPPDCMDYQASLDTSASQHVPRDPKPQRYTRVTVASLSQANGDS